MTLPLIRADVGDLLWILIMVGVAVVNFINASKKKVAAAKRERRQNEPIISRHETGNAETGERQLREFLESLGVPVEPGVDNPGPPSPRELSPAFPPAIGAASSSQDRIASQPPMSERCSHRSGVSRSRIAEARSATFASESVLSWTPPPIERIEDYVMPDLAKSFQQSRSRLDLGGLPLSALSMSTALPSAYLSGLNSGLESAALPELHLSLSDPREFRRALVAQTVLGSPIGWPSNSPWPCGIRP